jgi:hypothetical protein
MAASAKQKGQQKEEKQLFHAIDFNAKVAFFIFVVTICG